jgi:hypothetical protein
MRSGFVIAIHVGNRHGEHYIRRRVIDLPKKGALRRRILEENRNTAPGNLAVGRAGTGDGSHIRDCKIRLAVTV